ncbi:adenylate isopentenyltransferase-like [Mangifera indica]|uniref:adenylate isopentenyltransferase-like n=1 Tax=Mangifera indica TaxID=29780 RepID=UPI001CF9CB8B|nr:adenylate isopentenyltransferase-like [Mangifera indica]
MKLAFSPTTSTTHNQLHFSFLKRRRLPSRRSSMFTLMAAASTSTTSTTAPTFHHRRKRDKIIVIMGATGTGKSRLSIDLATRYFPSEIINSDKMQAYKGLDITTNKISPHERQNIPHHFLGEFDSQDGELTPLEFRHLAHLTISDIISRKKTPFIVGGSNSFIYSLLVEEYNPKLDAFETFNSVSSSLRYNCCFLWVDSSLPVLYEYLDKRVDEMFETGMFEELQEYFRESEELKYCFNSVRRTGLRKAIGLPEFEKYFREHTAEKAESLKGRLRWDQVRRGVYEEAIREIKENTRQLVKRQIGKIKKLRDGGWDLRRLDATAAFTALMTCTKKEEWRSVWEEGILEESKKIVERFLLEEGSVNKIDWG